MHWNECPPRFPPTATWSLLFVAVPCAWPQVNGAFFAFEVATDGPGSVFVMQVGARLGG